MPLIERWRPGETSRVRGHARARDDLPPASSFAYTALWPAQTLAAFATSGCAEFARLFGASRREATAATALCFVALRFTAWPAANFDGEMCSGKLGLHVDLDPSLPNRLDEVSVVMLVLIGILHRELANCVVKGGIRTHVTGDPRGISG